jgi:hypothetical protein
MKTSFDYKGGALFLGFPVIGTLLSVFLRRYDLKTICPRDTYGSHLGLTWLSPKNII